MGVWAVDVRSSDRRAGPERFQDEIEPPRSDREGIDVENDKVLRSAAEDREIESSGVARVDGQSNQLRTGSAPRCGFRSIGRVVVDYHDRVERAGLGEPIDGLEERLETRPGVPVHCKQCDAAAAETTDSEAGDGPSGSQQIRPGTPQGCRRMPLAHTLDAHIRPMVMTANAVVSALKPKRPDLELDANPTGLTGSTSATTPTAGPPLWTSFHIAPVSTACPVCLRPSAPYSSADDSSA